MIATILSADDPQWTTVLENAQHDVYHRPEYVQTAAEHEDGEPVAFFAKNDTGALFLPLLLRPLPSSIADTLGDSVRDASSPYGYPGPLSTTADASPHWHAFGEYAREQELLSVFLRLHPLLPFSREDVAHIGVPLRQVEHGPTVYIDCTADPSTLWSDTRPDHRSDIRRLQRRGYSATVEGPDALGVFKALYLQTMERVGARSFYRFSERYFDAWRGRLARFCQIMVVRADDGAPAAAGLFTDANGWVQFHLSGTDTGHRDLAPTKLMLDEMRRWAHDHGRSVLHLGGGLGGERDSLFDFKAGFSPDRALFQTVRMVPDAERYRAACHAAGSTPDSIPGDGFFPAYR